MSFNLNEHFANLKGNDVVFSFMGSITSEVIINFLENIEQKLTEASVVNTIRKKVYNVLLESLQNLFHHAEKAPYPIEGIENNKNFGLVVVKKDEIGYWIITGNFISTNKIKTLKDKIDKINSLSLDELKDMYKFILNHQKLTAKGGGGLGLVDIARKTGHKIEYAFQNINKDYNFLILNIFVS